jgi:hypothetical protein
MSDSVPRDPLYATRDVVVLLEYHSFEPVHSELESPHQLLKITLHVLSAFLIDWLIDWVIDWLTDWFLIWFTNWFLKRDWRWFPLLTYFDPLSL